MFIAFGLLKGKCFLPYKLCTKQKQQRYIVFDVNGFSITVGIRSHKYDDIA